MAIQEFTSYNSIFYYDCCAMCGISDPVHYIYKEELNCLISTQHAYASYSWLQASLAAIILRMSSLKA